MLKNKIFIDDSADKQQTVASGIIIQGPSIYTPRVVKLVIKPAPADFGLQFGVGGKLIPCLINYAKFDDSEHTTSLVYKGLQIKTVEHLLSSLWGMGVDNALLELDSGYIPTLDGSAEYYTKAIQQTGLEAQKANRHYIGFNDQHKFIESNSDPRYATFGPSSSEVVKSTTAFNNLIGSKTVAYSDKPDIYASQIAWARTFLRSPLDDEGMVWEHMRKIFPQLPQDHTKSPIIVFNDTRFFTPLKSDDEPARHKILDFVGDMALLGIRVKASIELFLPGHRFTRKIVSELRKELDSLSR